MRQHSRVDRSCAILVFVLFCCTSAVAQSQQEHVHGRSHSVMPFDMAKTLHVFTMTESGGVERVIVKDKRDREEVMLIQQHLRKEAARFSEGDYSDQGFVARGKHAGPEGATGRREAGRRFLLRRA
jgi:hypothetical protein